ncbi:MAG: TetR/AcrR family transcriptional regulator [Panacagrimonas sp.]
MKAVTHARKLNSRPARGASRLAPDLRIAEIEAAAREELADKGYQNFVPAEVARRCGVSEATIYRYFPTKRDLLIKVAEDWFEEMLAVEPEIARQTDVVSRLRHVIRHSLGVIRNQPALSRFVLQELRPDPSYRSMRIFDLNSRYTANVVKIVDEAIATGIFRPGIPSVLVRSMIYGAIEHQTWSYLRGEGDFDVEAAADGIASLICHGMAMTPLTDAALLAPAVSKLEADADSMRWQIQKLRALVSR